MSADFTRTHGKKNRVVEFDCVWESAIAERL